MPGPEIGSAVAEFRKKALAVTPTIQGDRIPLLITVIPIRLVAGVNTFALTPYNLCFCSFQWGSLTPAVPPFYKA